MSAFLDELRKRGTLRLEQTAYARAYYQAYPEHADRADRRALLWQALDVLAKEGHLRLPAAASRNWDALAKPKLPRFITLVSNKLEPPAPVDWLPVLQAAGATATRRRREDLARINDYLIANPNPPSVPVPFREKAVELFGDEKYFDRYVENGLLFGAVPLELIGAMVPVGPLASSTFPDARGKPLLVLENQHTYASCVQWNRRSKVFSAVAYGQGQAVTGAAEPLDELAKVHFTEAIYYFGDLDPMGIAIPAQLSIELQKLGANGPVPWLEAYSWLLENGARRPLADTKRQAVDTTWLGPLAAAALELFKGKGWIPQEALSLSVLTKNFSN